MGQRNWWKVNWVHISRTVQQTVRYAHQQNRKVEHFVCTIEDTMCALMVSSDLPPSYWPYATLTVAFLCCRLPTSTLPKDKTPFEMMTGSQPDYSCLCFWGCCAFPLEPVETRGKGASMHFEAVFVGYEEDRVSWGCVNLNGKYVFLNNVIFNKTTKGRLGAKKCLTSTPIPIPEGPHPLHWSAHTIIPMQKGSQYREDLQCKCDKISQLRPADYLQETALIPEVDFITEYAALAHAEAVLSGFPSVSLKSLKPVHSSPALPLAAVSTKNFTPCNPAPPTNLTNPLSSLKLARTRGDWDKWEEAMQHEVDSLEQKGCLSGYLTYFQVKVLILLYIITTLMHTSPI